MRAATYVRLSASGLGEDAPGLDRQRNDVERLVRERGWTLEDRHRFQETDTSAFRAGVVRPRFDELCLAVESREVDAVVVWKTDRAFRRIKEAADFLDLCQRRSVTFVSQQEGVDTSTPWGPVLFSLFASLGQMESKTKSDRITAWHQQRAEQGRPVGGGTRPYGFKRDGVAHEASEARVIRWAASRVLAGDTLRSIIRRMHDRGHFPVKAERWSPTTLKRVLVAPRTAGMREHGGENYPAEWKPILDQKTWTALCQIFDAETRPHVGRRYLLTGGLAVCGICGAKLVARPKGDGRRAYCCATDLGGCGKIRTLSAPIEEHVAEEVARRHEALHLDISPPIPQPGEPERMQLEADERALEELARDRYVTRSISDAEFRAARTPLVERIADGQQALAAAARGTRFSHVRRPEELPPPPWEVEVGSSPDQEDLASWREWIEEHVERVLIGPAVKGRNFFDPSRVQIVWAEGI